MEWIKDNLGKRDVEKVFEAVASILRHTFRGADILTSFGEGRFAGLAVDAAIDSSVPIYSRLQDNLRRLNLERKFRFELLLNTGIVTFDPEYPQTVEELLEDADELMKEQKKSKKQHL